MQILTLKNPDFEKPFRNPSNRTQVNILKKKNCGYLSKKFGSAFAHSPRKCSNFEFWRESKDRNEFFFENLPRAYKDSI